MALLPWLSFGTQALSSLLSPIFNRRSQSRAFDYNQRQSQQAYANDLDMWNRQSKWNVDMWRMQNQYNLPAAQMQRLRDAGLNPNLAAGGGAAGGQAAAIQRAEMPKYNPARANFSFAPIDMPSMLAAYNASRITDAQVDNLKAIQEVNKQKALTEATMRIPNLRGKEYANRVQYASALYAKAFNDLDLSTRQQRLKNLGLDEVIKGKMSDKVGAEARLRGKEAEWLEKYSIRPGDPLIYRFILKMLEQFGSGMSDSLPRPFDPFNP